MTLTYGNKSGGGSGATATATHGRADLAGSAEGTQRGHAHEPRLVAQHHRQRRRRLGNPHDRHERRLGEPDRQHDHLHLHGRNGRNQQRHRHPRRPRRLDRSFDDCGQRRLHNLERGDGVGGWPDDHDLVADARRRRNRDDHLRLDRRRRLRRDRHLEHRRADLAGTGEVHLRRRRSPTSAPRRASPSTRLTAPAR